MTVEGPFPLRAAVVRLRLEHGPDPADNLHLGFRARVHVTAAGVPRGLHARTNLLVGREGLPPPAFGAPPDVQYPH